MRHVTIFAQEGVYAGWPANHGHWQWGDELLFGFIRGKHNPGYGIHNVKGLLQKVLARSLDGGESWLVEVPNVDFEAEEVSPSPEFQLEDSIIRVCGGYDHGGENCVREGGFYLSNDRGKTWAGAYSFDGLVLPEKQRNTSRTCVVDGLIFLSAANVYSWGSDFVFCVTHDGRKFSQKAIVCEDTCRAVMPAVATVDGRMVAALRRRGGGRSEGWIDAFGSDDGGASWRFFGHVGETGCDNGNPPALVDANGKLYCAFANRSQCAVFVSVSLDGENWKPLKTLRTGGDHDIGYPRLFKRADGSLVCVYYWTEEFEKAQRIEATIFDP